MGDGSVLFPPWLLSLVTEQVGWKLSVTQPLPKGEGRRTPGCRAGASEVRQGGPRDLTMGVLPRPLTPGPQVGTAVMGGVRLEICP